MSSDGRFNRNYCLTLIYFSNRWKAAERGIRHEMDIYDI